MAFDFNNFGNNQLKPTGTGFDFESFGTSPVDGFGTVEKSTRPTFISKTKESLSKRLQGAKSSFAEMQAGRQDPLSTSIQILGQGAGAVGDIAGQAIASGVSTAYKALPDVIEKPITETAKAVGVDFLESDIGKAALNAVKGGVEAYNKFKAENPVAARNLEGVVNIGSLLPIGKGAQVGVKTAEKVAKGTFGFADEALEKTLQTATKPLVSIQDEVGKKVFKQTIDDWNKIGTDYVRTNKLLTKAQARGKDPALFLTERGIDPGSTVEAGARRQIADRIRTQDTVPFEEVLQKSLQIADESSPGINLNQIEVKLLNDLKTANVDVQKAKTLEKGIRERVQLLKEKYGSDVIKRQDLNAEKRAFWQNTGFDTTGNLAGDVNYRMGRALKEAIEDSVDDVNIKELNGILGDHYEAARFLDALDAKAGKLTTGEKVKKALVRSASTLVGAQLGDLGGGLTGFIVADSINAALRGADDAFKSFFLQNLRNTNPAKYDEYVKALKFIEQAELEKMTRPKLPAPKPVGSAENPIITPAPTTYEKPAGKIRRNQ